MCVSSLWSLYDPTPLSYVPTRPVLSSCDYVYMICRDDKGPMKMITRTEKSLMIVTFVFRGVP